MKRARNTLLVLSVLAATMATVVTFLQPHEPTYEGRRLGLWLNDLYPITSRYTAAYQAVRETGTNALPTMIKMLSAKNPFLKQKLVELVGRQSFIRVRFTSVTTLHEQAVTAFFILGPIAKPAIPELVELLADDTTAEQAARALVHADPDVALSLTKMLTNKSARVRSIAARTLGDIRDKSEIIVPALVRTLADNDPDTRFTTCSSLLRQDAAVAVPALIECLKGDKTEVRNLAIWMLELFGNRAKAAIPSLLMLLEDSDPAVSIGVARAILSIDPEMASRISKPSTL